MERLLVVDSSIQEERSVSRDLTRLAEDAWRRAHPDGVVRHRDLAEDGPDHLTPEWSRARSVPEGERTPSQAARVAGADQLAREVRDADTLILGVPLYNWNVPSTVKSWIDHLLASPLIRAPHAGPSLIAGLDVVLVMSRGGGYGPGTPKEGWDHATPWLLHVFESLGIEPRVVEVEMTLADVNPALARFKDLAKRSREAAEEAVRGLWAEDEVAEAV